MPLPAFYVRALQSGSKNLTLEVTGVLIEDGNHLTIEFGPDWIKPDQIVKVASLVWLIEEKAGIRLWWDDEKLLAPLESRSAVRFDSGMRQPDGWKRRIKLEAFNVLASNPSPKHFLLVMDFDK
jgi:hypothetical protein